ncbi:MAG: ABC transporter permease, partial [Clostridiales bacterium]|nr:ABC transporter permease [Clostridiales bacterium]
MIVVDLILNTLSQGLCYALVAMGVYISYKLLDFPDLSVDGSFPLGAVLSVVLIKADVPAIPAVLIAMIGGGIAGFITGFLHVKFK